MASNFYGTAGGYNPANLANTAWNQVNAPVSRAVSSAASLPKKYWDFAMGDDITNLQNAFKNENNQGYGAQVRDIGLGVGMVGLDAASLLFPELFALKGLKAANMARKSNALTPLSNFFKKQFVYGGDKVTSTAGKNAVTAAKASGTGTFLYDGVNTKKDFVKSLNPTPVNYSPSAYPINNSSIYSSYVPLNKNGAPATQPYTPSAYTVDPNNPYASYTRLGTGGVPATPAPATQMNLNDILAMYGIDAKTGLTASQKAFTGAKGKIASDAYKGIVSTGKNIIKTSDAGAARDIEQLKQQYTGGQQDTANLMADLGTLGSPAISGGAQISAENALRGGIQDVQTASAGQKAQALLDIASGKAALRNTSADIQMTAADYSTQNIINSILNDPTLSPAAKTKLIKEKTLRGL
jgi:hypothetical protein